MNQLVDVTLEVEQYRCRNYGRLFWVKEADRAELNLDFGCPYGCDGNGRHVCRISARVEKARTMPRVVEEPRVRL